MLDAFTGLAACPPRDAIGRTPSQRASDASKELAGMIAAGELNGASADARFRLRQIASETARLADDLDAQETAALLHRLPPRGQVIRLRPRRRMFPGTFQPDGDAA